MIIGNIRTGSRRLFFLIASAFLMWLHTPVHVLAGNNDVSASIAVTPGDHDLSIPSIPDGSEMATITVTITAASGWRLVRLDPAPAGWVGTYQRLYDGMSPGEAYEAVFSGELEPITTGSGGEGEKPDYTFTVHAEGMSGKPDFRVSPDEQVVCVGKSAEFTAEKRLNDQSPWEPKVSDWTFNSTAQPPAASSKTFATDDPGIFTVTAEANGLSGSATLTVVKVDSIDVWDTDNRHQSGGLLEVVPQLAGETITCKATMSPNVEPLPGCPEWTISGYWSSTLYGQQVDFPAANYASSALWLLRLTPHTYTIKAGDETCILKAYTNHKGEQTLAAPDLDAFKTAMDALEGVAIKLKSPVQVGAELKGSFSFENQWMESTDHLAHYTWTLSADANASANVKLKVGTGLVGLPPQLAEAALFVELKGALGVKGSASLDTAGAFVVSGGAYGSVALTAGGSGSIASGFIDIELTAASSIKATGTFAGEAKPPKVYSNVKVTAGGLEVGYKVGVIWGIWTSGGSYEMWEPWTLYDDTVQIVPW